ncbi:hypothetical protein IT568_06840 [bacterium]|nr:hypothetical protein [bacterium]
MRYFYFSIILALILSSCGGDPTKEALQALTDNKPNQAILLLEKESNRTPEINDILARAYFLNGTNLIQTNKKPEVGVRSLESGNGVLPAEASVETKQAKANLLIAIGDAFVELDLTDKAVEHYEIVAKDFPENTDAILRLEKLKVTRGQKFLSIALSGMQSGDEVQYYESLKNFKLAQKYLPDAVKYDSLYKVIYKSTRDMFSFDPYSIRVNDFKQDSKITGFLIDFKNNSETQLDLKVEKFKLVMQDGTEIGYNKSAYEESSDASFKSTSLKPFGEAGGILYFLGGSSKLQKTKIEKIVYSDGEVNLEKYLAY